jgi:hypothetical protein
MVGVVLLNARSIASVFPERFWIPGEEALAAIKPGMLVKVRALEVGPDDQADIWDSAPVWVMLEEVDDDIAHGTVTDSRFDRDEFRRGASLTVSLDRIFDVIAVDGDGRRGLNEARVRFALGKRVLIGLTEVGPDGEVAQHQFVGILSSVDPVLGIGFSLDGGGSYQLPPDGSALEEARPGSYRLRSTGETVVDPDYTRSWTVYRNASGTGVPATGSEI